MEIWQLWLESIRGALELLAGDAGLGVGLAIVALTLSMRILVLPLSWSAAYRGALRQRKLARLAPEIERLKATHAARPDAGMAAILVLYRKHGLSPLDGRGLFASFAQVPIFLGMFQVLRDVGGGVRFLWVQNLARPDVWLALIAAGTTALMMLANPDLPEHLRTFMLVVPSVIAAVVALNFGSALAVYWATSNVFSAAQTVAVHAVLARRIRAGAVRL